MDNKQKEFLNFVLEDVLDQIPGITSRAMFGGYGLYKNGVIFAIIAESKLFFKVGESDIDDYKKIDSRPFVYKQGNHKRTTMSYWLIPDELLYNKDKINEWVIKSVDVSKSGKKKK